MTPEEITRRVSGMFTDDPRCIETAALLLNALATHGHEAEPMAGGMRWTHYRDGMPAGGTVYGRRFLRTGVKRAGNSRSSWNSFDGHAWVQMGDLVLDATGWQAWRHSWVDDRPDLYEFDGFYIGPHEQRTPEAPIGYVNYAPWPQNREVKDTIRTIRRMRARRDFQLAAAALLDGVRVHLDGRTCEFIINRKRIKRDDDQRAAA